MQGLVDSLYRWHSHLTVKINRQLNQQWSPYLYGPQTRDFLDQTIILSLQCRHLFVFAFQSVPNRLRILWWMIIMTIQLGILDNLSMTDQHICHIRTGVLRRSTFQLHILHCRRVLWRQGRRCLRRGEYYSSVCRSASLPPIVPLDIASRPPQPPPIISASPQPLTAMPYTTPLSGQTPIRVIQHTPLSAPFDSIGTWHPDRPPGVT